MGQRTCNDRIAERLKSRIHDFRQALNGTYSDGEQCEDFIEFINSYALAYSDHPHYRAKWLELSWGGPQDYFLFFKDGEIEYHFLDWLDGATMTLYGSDYDTMAEVRDYLGE